MLQSSDEGLVRKEPDLFWNWRKCSVAEHPFDYYLLWLALLNDHCIQDLSCTCEDCPAGKWDVSTVQEHWCHWLPPYRGQCLKTMKYFPHFRECHHWILQTIRGEWCDTIFASPERRSEVFEGLEETQSQQFCILIMLWHACRAATPYKKVQALLETAWIFEVKYEKYFQSLLH